MQISSKDIEKIALKPFKEPWFTRPLSFLIRMIAKIPSARGYFDDSVGGLSGRIFRCRDNREYEKAVQLAIYALERYRQIKSRFLPGMDHHNWWSFMSYGVESAEMIENDELREKLIDLANTGMTPFAGYFVAYSFLIFSRWKYEANNIDDAFKYAEIASKADSSWAEPDFILGWYGLVLGMGEGDAGAHLSRAVDKDRRILARIANDDICRKYPHIINKLF